MNYLAHARLSFDQPEILVGNLISDFVKGKRQFTYPDMVQKGIRLHRAIDTFTDVHPFTQELKSFFRPQYRLYCGALADIVYDHFLANDTDEFAELTELKEFARKTYGVLENKMSLLPSPFQQMFPHMKMHDWLYHYRFTEGVRKSFVGLARRATYIADTDIAFEIFNREYEMMGSCYKRFYPELKDFAYSQYEQLLKL